MADDMRTPRRRKPSKTDDADASASATTPTKDKKETGGSTKTLIIQQAITLCIALTFLGASVYIALNPEIAEKIGAVIGLVETAEPQSNNVVTLTATNFDSFIKENNPAMVEFYAPWCGHCKKLAKPYAEAADTLKGIATLAAVDAIAEKDLADRYEIKSFPTLYFFQDGEKTKYSAGLSSGSIVAWTKKRVYGPISELKTEEDIQSFKQKGDTSLIGFFSEDDKEISDTFRQRAISDDDRSYALGDVALMSSLNVKQTPAVVMLRTFDDGDAIFDCKKGAHDSLSDAFDFFINVHRTPLVLEFGQLTQQDSLFPWQKASMLVFGIEDKEGDTMKAVTQVAKGSHDKMAMVYAPTKDDKRLRSYLGVPEQGLYAIITEVVDEKRKKYPLNEALDGLSAEEAEKKLSAHFEAFRAGQLKPSYKSSPVPESNSEPVKVVVGSQFEEMVMDSEKHVFLEIYAPWCGHCKQLAPTWDKLAQHYDDREDVVIAKMDGTDNESPHVEVKGFPTLILFPKGENKVQDKYSGGRKYDELLNYLEEKIGTKQQY
eukprot:m.18898 g.18898  ORF g.18898 m.18898 type:complete len:545 (+) comp6442_c0_seq1:200-1834(+)